MGMSRERFMWADYVVFAAVLLFSAAVGVYFALTGSRQRTQSEYLMGDRNLQTIPVGLSMLMSILTAITVLGLPAEIYISGTQYYLYGLGACVACVLVALLFVPLLHPLRLTSSYEYFQRRFNSRAAKVTGALLLILQQLLFMAMATYSPAVALEAVAGFPVYATILLSVVVATFYTTLGGMKAVVWTDAFQSLVLIAGLLAIVIAGSLEVGGVGKMWQTNYEGGRVNFFDFDPDPTKRHSFWSLIVGGAITWMGLLGVNQAATQRFCSLSSIKKAQRSLLSIIPSILIVNTLCLMSGMVVYAYFADCDPLRSKKIKSPNQLLPHLLMQVLAYPAVPGLFVATIFSGTLSTLSSSLTAVSAITWEDLLKWKLDYLSERVKTAITKVLVVVYGAIAAGLAFAFGELPGTVFIAAISFAAASNSPILGMFLLGGLFPMANWIGAIVGAISGLTFAMWISVGTYMVNPYRPTLGFSVEDCTNFTLPATTNKTVAATPELEGLNTLYTLSPMWIPAIGTFTTVVVGLLVSAVTGCTPTDEVDDKYLIPIGDRLCCCLPNSTLRVLRWGRPRMDSKPAQNGLTDPGKTNAGLDVGNEVDGQIFDTAPAQKEEFTRM